MGSHSKDKERDVEGSSSRKHKSSKKGKESKSRSGHKDKDRKSKDKKSSRVVDDDGDENEEDMWVEKGDAGAEEPNSVANIPSRDSLHLTSHASPSSSSRHPPLPPSVTTESLTREKRDQWMLDDGVPIVRDAPMRQSDNLHSGGTFSVGSMPTGIAKPSSHNTIEQFTDGYGEGEVGTKGSLGGDDGDFFSAMGNERRKKKDIPVAKTNPEAPKMHSRELNTGIYRSDGSRLDSPASASSSAVREIAQQPSSNSNTADGTRPPLPGSTGSSWRMMKLKRAHEAAEEEGRSIDDVGVERFGSVDLYEAAKEERRYLDEQRSGGSRSGTPSRGGTPNAGLVMRGREMRPPFGSSGSGPGTPAAEDDGGLDEFGRERRKDEGQSTPQAGSQAQPRYMFTEPGSAASSRPPSRAGSFRRPGAVEDALTSSRPGTAIPQQNRASGGSKPSTPIPSVFTPTLTNTRKPSNLQLSSTMSSSTEDAVKQAQGDQSLVSQPPMSPTSLNRLQAKILRLRLMGDSSAPSTELKDLEEKYERESHRARQGDGGEGYFDSKDVGGSSGNTEIRVLPTLDGRGKLYDIGRRGEEGGDTGVGGDKKPEGAGNKRKRKEAYFETRDSATGELLRYNADDDTTSLEELVRQERFGAGSSDTKNMDYELASRITGDAKFEDDLDYMDDSADRLARKKLKTEAQKKMFAINDFNKTRKALESCQFCYQDTEHTTVPPQAAVVAMGTRAYLALPLSEPLVEGHALIVPMQHHLSSLEADDDTWDEMKNFMKTLMQMHAERDYGVLFYETVISFKGQRHTYIEAVPLPWDKFEEMPVYFREAILTTEAEWSQHKKLIDFSARPGGFRRSLVSNLPYFMVHWDYKGEKGFGHVIEGPESAEGAGDGYDFDEGAKGGGEFHKNFAAEIIGNVCELEPRLWRRPRRMDRKLNDERVKQFRKSYDRHDWTKMLSQTSDAK